MAFTTSELINFESVETSEIEIVEIFMRLRLLILLSVLNLAQSFAVHPLVRNFRRESYKSGPQNWDIAHDKMNVVYFANNDGLLEFDGVRWSTYPVNNLSVLRSVLCTSENRIYTGASNEFGYYQSTRDGKLKYNSLVGYLPDEFKNFNEVWNILEAGKFIYFQSDWFIFRYDGDTVICFPFRNKICASAYISNVLFIASIEEGIYTLNGDLFIKIQGSELIQNKKVVSILPYKNGEIMFITSFNGVFIFDGVSIVPFKTEMDDFLMSNQVFTAATDGKQIAYGTVRMGIVVQNVFDKSVTYVNTRSGLQNNTVLSISFDNHRNLWLGLDKGIDYVLLNTPFKNIFGTNDYLGAGYTSLLKKDILYLGTNQGLYTTSYPIPESYLPLDIKKVEGIKGQVWCLADIDNTVFCGNDHGTFIISESGIEPILGIHGTWVLKQLRKNPDMILGCSYQGLYILKKTSGKWKLSHFLKGEFNYSGPIIEEDDDGTIWFGHWLKGIFHLQFNSSVDSIIKIDLYDADRGFTISPNNSLFRVDNEIIFSSDHGLYVYNRDKDRMEQCDKWNKIFVSPPFHMRLHQSPGGDVWCVSSEFAGIAKKTDNGDYLIDSVTFKLLQPKLILGFEHFGFIGDNKIIIANEDGFYWVDSNFEVIRDYKFNVFLRNVLSVDKVHSERETGKIWNNNISDTFSKKQSSLRFEFVAPEFRNSDMVKYSTKLQNYDESWSDFSLDNIREYTHLPKGHYVFMVRAYNVLESSIAECKYELDIMPAWFETRFAYVIYVLFLLFTIGGSVFWVDSRIKLGAKKMERQKELEIMEQKLQFEAITNEKKREIKELKKQNLQYELRHKSQELANSTMNLIRKNEILIDISENITEVAKDIDSNADRNKILSSLNQIGRMIHDNISADNNWKKFEENYDIVYENFLKRLEESFPELNVCEKRICAYLKMGLTSKDIAPLINMSVRSVEMSRYRMRKKMKLGSYSNLGNFLQKF